MAWGNKKSPSLGLNHIHKIRRDTRELHYQLQEKKSPVDNQQYALLLVLNLGIRNTSDGQFPVCNSIPCPASFSSIFWFVPLDREEEWLVQRSRNNYTIKEPHAMLALSKIKEGMQWVDGEMLKYI